MVPLGTGTQAAVIGGTPLVEPPEPLQPMMAARVIINKFIYAKVRIYPPDLPEKRLIVIGFKH
jgi:hypothetical protein